MDLIESRVRVVLNEVESDEEFWDSEWSSIANDANGQLCQDFGGISDVSFESQSSFY